MIAREIKETPSSNKDLSMSHEKYNMNINFNAGYVCGVLCSGGTIRWKKGNYWLKLETIDDGFADRFLFMLATLTSGKVRSYQRQRNYRGKKYITNIVILSGKKHVKSFIERWKVRTGSHTWSVPSLAFHDQDFRKGFLQGFFDGDATIRLRLRIHRDGRKQKCRTIRITSVNLNGLKQLKKLLELEGIDCVIYPVKNHYFLEIDGKNRVAQFVKKINFGIPRKRKKIELSLDPVRFEEAMKL
jgi:hypothetical protein